MNEQVPNEYSEDPRLKVWIDLPNPTCEYFRAVLHYWHPAPGSFVETVDTTSRSPTMAVSHALHALGDKLEARYRKARAQVETAIFDGIKG